SDQGEPESQCSARCGGEIAVSPADGHGQSTVTMAQSLSRHACNKLWFVVFRLISQIWGSWGSFRALCSESWRPGLELSCVLCNLSDRCGSSATAASLP